MPLTGVYTWEENKETVRLRVPLKGVSRRTVDVTLCDLFLKVNFAPYLLLVDLLHPIDEDSSTAVYEDGALVLSLAKEIPRIWEKVEVEGLSKAQIRERRDAAMAAKAEKEAAKAQAKKDKRYDAEQLAMKSEWAIVDAEKQHIETLKEEEKTRAEEDVYRALAEVQAAEAAKKDKKGKKGKKAKGAGRRVTFAEKPAPSAEEARLAAAEAAAEAMLAEEEAGVLESKERVTSDIFGDADSEDEDEDEDEDIVYVPPPRNSSKVTMNFTERIFPTPLRESKVAQEEDWIAKNKAALDKRRKQVNPDARDISERDPVWLKGKADDFYHRGDIRAAANAYSSAIAADPSVASCYSNRAACFLQLGELQRCVDDCNSTLEILPAPADSALAMAGPSPSPEQQRWFRLTTKVLVRRGTALCRLGKYQESIADLKLVADMKPSDAAVAADLKRVENLTKCAGLKALGDASFRTRSYGEAVKQYTAALTFDPHFVSCFSNRAACFLASNDFARCVDDCSTALQLMGVRGGSGAAEAGGDGDKADAGAGGGAKPEASGPVPSKGSDRHKAWVLKTAVRRGAALAKMGKLLQAKKDYEWAVEMDPDNEDLMRDLRRIRIRCPAEPEAGADKEAAEAAARADATAEVVSAAAAPTAETEETPDREL